MSNKFQTIPERRVAGKRTGRIINHDEASKEYVAEQASTIQSVSHLRRAAIFDQGDLGSCTGNALAGAMMTEPIWRPHRYLDEGVARLFYSLATRIDYFGGVWPPNDVGSSGLAVMKAAQWAGYISGYRWTFSLDSCLKALVLAPVIIGINWYDSFDEPANGLLEITPNASVRGAHEVVLRSINATSKRVGGDNSWGPAWGVHGQFAMSFDTLGRLLDEDGDCVVPVP